MPSERVTLRPAVSTTNPSLPSPCKIPRTYPMSCIRQEMMKWAYSSADRYLRMDCTARQNFVTNYSARAGVGSQDEIPTNCTALLVTAHTGVWVTLRLCHITTVSRPAGRPRGEIRHE